MIVIAWSTMCGRFSATFSFRELRWNLQGDLPSFAPSYNIAPSQSVPVIVKGERGNEAKLMKWGSCRRGPPIQALAME
jgi:putative SOS response-associated peptidase YedK